MSKQWVGFGIAASWIVFFLFLWPGLYYETPQGLFANHRSVWADWTVHLTFVTHFLKSPTSQWVKENPLFLGVPFNYPFAVHLLIAGLVRLGLAMTTAMLLSSIVLLSAFFGLLFWFYFRRLDSSLKGSAAMTLFLTGGAAVGFVLFFQDLFGGHPMREYGYLPKVGLEVGNFLSVSLIPQKAFQLGAVAGLLVLLALSKLPDLDPIEEKAKRIQIAAGILVGLLPIIHVHTFVAMGLTIAVFFFFHRNRWRSFIPFAITAAVTTAVVMALLHRASFRKGFLMWEPGWLAHYSKNRPYGWLTLWWLNWGAFLPLAWLALFRRKQTQKDYFFWSGLILFLVANLVRFQPWDWDNTKLFLWAYLLMVPAVIEYLSDLLASREKINRIAVGVLFFTLICTGLLEVFRLRFANRFHAEMFSRDEIKLADFFSKKLTPEDIVLTAPHHHNWVSALSGARILMGFDGWLFSSGIDYKQRLEDIKKMFVGGKDTKELLKKYGVTYIVANENAKRDYHINTEFMEKNFTKVLVHPLATIYRVTAK